MNIARWFQGSAVCGGHTDSPICEEPLTAEMYVLPQCLWTQAALDGLGMAQTQHLADVADRLFSSRCLCDAGRFSPITKLIHTNNNPATTREDIDKILRVFTEETDARSC